MATSQDITGLKFGRLTVLRQFIYTPPTRRTYAKCDCLCECGKIKTVVKALLLNGHTKSCGCLHSEVSARRLTIDGRLKHRVEYQAWRAAKSRCLDPKNPSFPRYGGRGVTMDEAWASSFHQFLADMGTRPPDSTLDRIDNDSGYKPGNCRWVTMKVQQNNRSDNRLVTLDGKTMTLAQWSEALGISRFRVLSIASKP